jgi:hypothetical protein
LSTVANANTYLKDIGMGEYQAISPQPSCPKISQRLPNQMKRKISPDNSIFMPCNATTWYSAEISLWPEEEVTLNLPISILVQNDQKDNCFLPWWK